MALEDGFGQMDAFTIGGPLTRSRSHHQGMNFEAQHVLYAYWPLSLLVTTTWRMQLSQWMPTFVVPQRVGLYPGRTGRAKAKDLSWFQLTWRHQLSRWSGVLDLRAHKHERSSTRCAATHDGTGTGSTIVRPRSSGTAIFCQEYGALKFMKGGIAQVQSPDSALLHQSWSQSARA
ncbi:hypothetical protein ABBQ38_011425 [Trebouxia sp. C0009 RCD-2024]